MVHLVLQIPNNLAMDLLAASEEQGVPINDLLLRALYTELLQNKSRLFFENFRKEQQADQESNTSSFGKRSILKVIPYSNFSLDIYFDDTLTGHVNMKPFLSQSGSWADMNEHEFRDVQTTEDGIFLQWRNGLKISADALYFQVRQKLE